MKSFRKWCEFMMTCRGGHKECLFCYLLFFSTFLKIKVVFISGTGSTSWTYNVNKLTEQNMEEILTIVKEETGFKIRDTDEKFVRKITETFNQMLITSPGNLSGNNF